MINLCWHPLRHDFTFTVPSRDVKRNTTKDQTTGNGEANSDAETQDGMEIVVTSALMSNSSSVAESGMEIVLTTAQMSNSSSVAQSGMEIDSAIITNSSSTACLCCFLFIISICLAVVSRFSLTYML